ncbi:MAG: hypothetical protein LBH77_08720 [Tannerella sp.]|nr:hypothetical protein [Tannerella sp.]
MRNFRIYFMALTVLLVSGCGNERAVKTSQPVNIIFDTDIGSDCDDAGALAVLHKFADDGLVNIVGVIFSSGTNRYGVGACDAINTWYGRGDLPLGQYKGSDVGDPNDHFTKLLATGKERFGHRVVDHCADMIDVYKNVLEKQPDRSVTIVTVGHPHGLCHLMNSPKGMDLIRKKVIKCVSMAGTSPEPQRDWNFGRNGAELYVRDFLERWPTDLYFSTAGKHILTGNKLLPLTPEDNPVRVAYENFFETIQTGRMSWDQVALLFAVRPELFSVESQGSLVQDDRYCTYWDTNKNNPKHHKVTPVISDEELTVIIESMMAARPANRRR